MILTVIHTSSVSLKDLMGLFEIHLPGVEVLNIIDDSLLKEVKQNNGINESIIKRMETYVKIAVSNGSDIIFNQCSSVGEAFDLAVKNISLPTLKIDQPMAEEAVKIGDKIALVATVESTLKPSSNLILKEAEKIGKKIILNQYLVDGALDILMKEKDVVKHNKLVLDTISKASTENDVVVLAQGSMFSLREELHKFEKPILTSPLSAILKLKEMRNEIDK